MAKTFEKPVLLFNAHAHYLDALLAQTRTAPSIGVEREKVDLDISNLFYIGIQPASATPSNSEVVFVKYDGRFVVLLGQDKVRAALEQSQATIRGRLLSSPALKKARVPEEVIEVPVPKTYTEEFANRPRWSDNRTTPTERRGSYPNVTHKPARRVFVK